MEPQPKLASFVLRKIQTNKNQRSSGTSGDMEKLENSVSIQRNEMVSIHERKIAVESSNHLNYPRPPHFPLR